MDKNTYTLIEDASILANLFNDYKDRFEEKSFKELKLRFENNFKVLKCDNNNVISLMQFIPRRAKRVKLEDFYEHEIVNEVQEPVMEEEENASDNSTENTNVEKSIDNPTIMNNHNDRVEEETTTNTHEEESTTNTLNFDDSNTEKNERRKRVAILLKIASINVDPTLLDRIVEAVEMDLKYGKADVNSFLPEILKFVEKGKNL